MPWSKTVGAALVCLAVLDCGGRALDLCPVIQRGAEHVPNCPQPSRTGASACIRTETSVCTKTCPADGGHQSVECTGFCRCEPECGGTCTTQCCKLAYNLDPPGCDVHQWNCQYAITYYEHATCSDSGACICERGFCGFDVSPEGEMSCTEGMGAPCMACPKGSFKPSSGTQVCASCGEGMGSTKEGGTNPADCRKLCQPGHASADGFEPCDPCLEGTFQEEAGQLLCKSCSNGTTTEFNMTNSSELCVPVLLEASAPAPARPGWWWAGLLAVAVPFVASRGAE